MQSFASHCTDAGICMAHAIDSICWWMINARNQRRRLCHWWRITSTVCIGDDDVRPMELLINTVTSNSFDRWFGAFHYELCRNWLNSISWLLRNIYILNASRCLLAPWLSDLPNISVSLLLLLLFSFRPPLQLQMLTTYLSCDGEEYENWFTHLDWCVQQFRWTLWMLFKSILWHINRFGRVVKCPFERFRWWEWIDFAENAYRLISAHTINSLLFGTTNRTIWNCVYTQSVLWTRCRKEWKRLQLASVWATPSSLSN